MQENSILCSTATTLSNNQIVVAWTHEVIDGFTTEHHIKAQLFDIDGTKIGSTIDVNTGVVKDGNFDGSVLPIITDLEGNDFLISWSGMSPDLNGINEYPGKILMQRFNACGVKQGSEILLDTEQPNKRLAGYLAAEKKDDGNILLSWGNKVENLLYAQSISPYETGETSKLNMIDDAIAYVVQHRAALGANINRLSSAISNLTTLSHNKKASLGTVADADMATEVTQVSKTQLLEQA